MTMNNMNHNYRSAPIQLSEAVEGENSPKEVQLLKTGTFNDPRYGKFSVTSKMLTEMVSNFKKGIRGIKPAIDFKHETDAEAAAWIKDIFTKENDSTLWAIPDWTGEGQRKLSDRVYGYLSADFNQNYKDNEKGESHGCVLLGAALTNRPVIKNMQPVIQLSEGDSMQLTPEQLAKLDALMKQMGIASVEDLIAAIAKMKPAEDMEKKEVELGDMSKQLSEKSTKLSEVLEENKKLKEEKETSSLETKFNLMLSEGKAIPAQKEAFMKGDLMKFAELTPKGGVKVEEVGTEDGNKPAIPGSAEDNDDKVLKLAEEKVKKNEAKDMPTAMSMVLKEQPELAKGR